MHTIKRGSIILLSGLVLTACGVEDSPEAVAENWPEYIQEGEEALESYSSDTQLDIDMAMAQGLMTDSSESFTHIQIVGDLEKGYTEDSIGELYFDGTDMYTYEGNSWNHYPDSDPIEYPSWYPYIVDSLIEIEDFIEATSTDSGVELSYDGNDREVWEAFEEEFSLTIDGISEENVNITLNATIDETSYYLQDLSLDIIGEEIEHDVEVASIAILVDVTYYDHDAVDLSDIEAEISEDTGN